MMTTIGFSNYISTITNGSTITTTDEENNRSGETTSQYGEPMLSFSIKYFICDLALFLKHANSSCIPTNGLFFPFRTGITNAD
jgi:hypothetical protein